MRQLQTRINLNYRPLSRLSMDFQVMPRSNKGHTLVSRTSVIYGTESFLIPQGLNWALPNNQAHKHN